MNWNKHSNLEGCHAEIMTASTPAWLNYDEDKLTERFWSNDAKKTGTELHDIAKGLIKHGLKQPRQQKTFNMYVNDAIGFKMRPEQVLYYSHNCFGTADAICFRHNLLRVHDLKTGVVPAHMEQLYVYDALFCLEYGYSPADIKFENRIYQNNEIYIATPEVDVILPIMDKIKTFSKLLDKLQEERN